MGYSKITKNVGDVKEKQKKHKMEVKKIMGKKRKKDLFDNVMDTGLVGVGTMAGVGLAGKTGELLHSPSTSSIHKGMQPMALLPTMSAAGGVFGQLERLNKKVKKRR